MLSGSVYMGNVSSYVKIVSSFVFFFKQKPAYEMRISDWGSDVCSSDLVAVELVGDRVGKGVEGSVDDIGGNADRRPAPARAVGALDHHAGHGVGAGDRKRVVEGKSV